jgi:hypothetical protein
LSSIAVPSVSEGRNDCESDASLALVTGSIAGPASANGSSLRVPPVATVGARA